MQFFKKPEPKHLYEGRTFRKLKVAVVNQPQDV